MLNDILLKPVDKPDESQFVAEVLDKTPQEALVKEICYDFLCAENMTKST